MKFCLKNCGIMEQEEQIMTSLSPISQTGCNTFQLREFCLTYLKSTSEFHKDRFLLFLLYINNSHNSIRFSCQFHFTDDTALLKIQDTISVFNKTLNKDLRELV